MKKRFCLLVCFLLAALCLTGCGNKTAKDTPSKLVTLVEEKPAVTMEMQPTLAPENTVAPKDPSEQEIDMMDDADTGTAETVIAETEAPTPEPAPAVSLNFSYTPLEDTSLGFTFEYPIGWKNIPGVFTMCFSESDSTKPVPMRVAITKKTLVHTPSEETLTNQLKDYLKVIYKQYDKSTFQVTGLNKQIKFLDQPALSTTYLAFKGETEVKGFVITTNVERAMYVFHFYGSYGDYIANESAMWYMLNSATTQLDN